MATPQSDGLNPLFWRAYVPKGPLARFVEVFWYYEQSRVETGKDWILPGGALQFVIRLGEGALSADDRRFRGSVINGAHTRPFVIDKGDQDRLFGVQFKPGGAFPFLAMPASDLQNQHLTLEEIWGSAATGLRERLVAAKDAEAMFAVAEAWLLAAAAKPLRHHPAVRYALGRLSSLSEPLPAVADLAGEVNLGRRRFADLFKEQVGVAPKLYARIQRFQRTLQLIPAGPVDWADLALAAGYFDQAHFIHDFKDLSGLTPATYAALRGEHLSHVPVPGG